MLDIARLRVIAAIAALVIGLEVAGKLGRALGDGHYLRGWHATATVGAFSAAAAAADRKSVV